MSSPLPLTRRQIREARADALHHAAHVAAYRTDEPAFPLMFKVAEFCELFMAGGAQGVRRRYAPPSKVTKLAVVGRVA